MRSIDGKAPPAGARYMTLAEASAICSTPTETLRKWIQSGRLRGYRPGKALLVREDELRSYVESRETRNIRAAVRVKGST